MKFTDKLDHLMKQNGLNKRTFALKCDIPYTTVCGWYDRGYDGVRMSTIRKISEAFGTSLEYWAYDELEETKKAPAPKGAEDESSISMERSNRLYDALVAAGLIVDDNFAPEDMKFLMHIADVIEDWFARKQAQ